ncbi:MAG: M81 family metallopeptidase [Armatimonadetes bacterium]|nr:M81 family metallopeptidase [Armatimonadota bacterium]
MPNILIAECKQEVSSFNPVPSSYADFVVTRGAAILERRRGSRSETGGALSVFDARSDLRLTPTYSSCAITSGGTLQAADFQRIAEEFCEAVAAASPVDACYFSLHGAMSAEGEEDPEGYLLAQARKILGERIPFVLSLDLHGILTDRMLQHSDAAAVYHTYPHVDMFSTGQRAARLLHRILEEGARPVTAMVRVPALVRGDEMITATGRIRHVIQAAQEIEASPGGLSAAMFWGNPFTDVENLRSNSLVTIDGDRERAEREAIRLASLFWEHHEWMFQPLISVEEAVQQTLAATEGTTILMDAADAPSSGASGDSNVLVRALLEAGYRGRILAPVVDPAAAEAAFAAGVGATIRTTVGGALDPGRFRPLPIEARVRLLSDGAYVGEAWGASYSGRTAVLEAGRATLIVTTRPVSLHDRGLFWAHGQEPRRFDVVVVKCPHCEPQMFKEWAARYLNVDAPGSTSANLHSLGHTRCARPIFPLDAGVEFVPTVRVFQRNS